MDGGGEKRSLTETTSTDSGTPEQQIKKRVNPALSYLTKELNKNPSFFISGPISFYYIKSNSVNILLVGDIHFSLKNICNDNNSIDYAEYMEKFFRTRQDKTSSIDYFAEETFETTDIRGDEGKDAYVLKTIEVFKKKGCFSLDKQKQKNCTEIYKNIRFHITDIRLTKINTGYKYDNLIDITLYIAKIKLYLELCKNQNISPQIYEIEYNNILILMNNLKNKEYLRSIYNESLKHEKIQKQFAKCDKGLVNMLTKLYIEKYDKIVEKYRFYDTMDNITFQINNDTKDIDKIIKMLGSLWIFLARFNARSVDVYIIARIFKNMNVPEGQDPYKRNIIIHIGNDHVLNILDIFTTQFKYEIVSQIPEKNSNRCLDLKDFKMPFGLLKRK